MSELINKMFGLNAGDSAMWIKEAPNCIAKESRKSILKITEVVRGKPIKMVKGEEVEMGEEVEHVGLKWTEFKKRKLYKNGRYAGKEMVEKKRTAFVSSRLIQRV